MKNITKVILYGLVLCTFYSCSTIKSVKMQFGSVGFKVRTTNYLAVTNTTANRTMLTVPNIPQYLNYHRYNCNSMYYGYIPNWLDVNYEYYWRSIEYYNSVNGSNCYRYNTRTKDKVIERESKPSFKIPLERDRSEQLNLNNSRQSRPLLNSTRQNKPIQVNRLQSTRKKGNN